MGWDDTKGESDGMFLRIEPEKKVHVHIVTDEPFSYQMFYNKATKKYVKLPIGFVVPKGVKMQKRHAFVVLMEELVDDEKAVVQKVFECGKKLALMLKESYDAYGETFSKNDFLIGKTGKDLKTVWSATAIPLKGLKLEDGVELIQLDKVIKFSTEEEARQNLAVVDENGMPVPF